LERSRETDVQRIVALEINMAHIKDSQGRIEHQLEKMEAEGAKGRAEIIESLREMREVKPRGS
jgi:predicted  nucleic acid-binding Zn-ribbon protein